MKQKMVTTERDCKARLVPAGNPTVIPEGEFVNITQELGGNYTVTWRGNIYRIDGTDAGAIGRKAMTLSFDAPEDGNISEQQVWDALETIFDPEIPINLVSLGLIYKVEIDQGTGSVNIDMTLTAPGCPVAGDMPGWIENAARTVEGIADVEVRLTFDPPWDPSRMSDEARLALNML